MTSRVKPERRARHRRRAGRRRAVVGGLSAFALTGAAVVTSTMMSSSASAATTWPTANGSEAVSATIPVSGTRDGGMKRYYGSGDLAGDGQEEGQDPIFRLADGATLKNVIIGKPGADGIHCQGSCNLQNVWWEDVGEDAATFRGGNSATYTVYGGGARKAADKVFQHNGGGKLVVSKFAAQDFKTLYRSCGNCSTQYKRTSIFNTIEVTAPGSRLVGINTNYGDTAALRGITIIGDSGKKIVPCQKYIGNNTGAEPPTNGSGPDGTHCNYTTSDLTYQ
ncbi:pectate lyase [Streptomyces phaeochromogenes]|uniref:pectate lyase n=1 Tax=Streptomyces phaeochromogenes TaxID=1923 RepID=UPI0033E13320